jgi:hypothetical protein
MQPSSQSPQLPKHSLRWLSVLVRWLSALVWIVIVLFALCLLVLSFLDSEPDSQKPLLLGDGAYAYDPIDLSRVRPLGSAVTVEDLRVTVTDARPFTTLPDWDTPRPGTHYWIVEVTFENRSPNQPIKLNISGLWIQAAKARALHYTARSPKQSVDAGVAALYPPLQPSAVVHTTLIHEVPTTADGLLWVYYGGESQPPSQNIATFTIKE